MGPDEWLLGLVVSGVWLGVALVGRFCVGGLLTASALHQLANLRSFRTTVESYRVLPSKAARLAAAPIAVAELILGMALLLGLGPRIISAVAALLLTVFAGAMIVNLARNRRIPCGCTGGAEEPISVRHVVRNAGLVAMLVAIFIAPTHPWSIEWLDASSSTPSTDSWIDVAVAMFVTIAIWLLWSMFSKILSFAAREI